MYIKSLYTRAFIELACWRGCLLRDNICNVLYGRAVFYKEFSRATVYMISRINLKQSGLYRNEGRWGLPGGTLSYA